VIEIPPVASKHTSRCLIELPLELQKPEIEGFSVYLEKVQIDLKSSRQVLF